MRMFCVRCYDKEGEKVEAEFFIGGMSVCEEHLEERLEKLKRKKKRAKRERERFKVAY